MAEGKLIMTIDTIIRRSIDLHVHIGPEIIPRKFTVPTLITEETGNIAGMALKNHFFPTVPFINEINSPEIILIGSVVLNNFVGGLNPDGVYAASTLTKKPFIVWFPTVSSKQFLSNSRWEIAPEWVQRQDFFARASKTVNGIELLDANGKLKRETVNVLKAIKQAGAILATGHISWQESLKLVKAANALGIKKIIVTHPIYQKIAMPIAVQKHLTTYGAKIEHCFSMYSIDNIPISEIASQIKAVGYQNCIMSSDVGQTFSPSPSIALKTFSQLLAREGISLGELTKMLVDNPQELIAI
ncbi:MAG: DUF6282 family protein [Patescibacteria group bacterium]